MDSWDHYHVLRWTSPIFFAILLPLAAGWGNGLQAIPHASTLMGPSPTTRPQEVWGKRQSCNYVKQVVSTSRGNAYGRWSNIASSPIRPQGGSTNRWDFVAKAEPLGTGLQEEGMSESMPTGPGLVSGRSSNETVVDNGEAEGREDCGREQESWVRSRWRYALNKMKKEPLQTLTIPISAACVGWITNKLAVEMIFYPLVWRGIPLRVVQGQPLGLIGWQGIVPAKAGVMAERMVDMVTTQLVDVEEVFRRLSPSQVSRLLSPEVNQIAEGLFADLLPGKLLWLPQGLSSKLPSQVVDELKGLRRRMLVDLTKDMQKHIKEVLDLKALVVGEMVRDKEMIVGLFQRCGKAEFSFLVNSGLWFGFLLGVIQMFVWLLYDKPWTLPAGGAVVGYLTNWLALKLIFEPVDPVRVGPFNIQGLFLKRQNEVAADFAEFFATNVLTSRKMWGAILSGPKASTFALLLSKHLRRFLSRASAAVGANLDPLLVKGLAERAAEKMPEHVHVLHDYTDKTLRLQETMRIQMQKMSSRSFEGVLHPIFQEDEFTLIVAGGVLGALAGFAQMLVSTKPVREAATKAAARTAGASEGISTAVVGESTAKTLADVLKTRRGRVLSHIRRGMVSALAVLSVVTNPLRAASTKLRPRSRLTALLSIAMARAGRLQDRAWTGANDESVGEGEEAQGQKSKPDPGLGLVSSGTGVPNASSGLSEEGSIDEGDATGSDW